MSQAPAISVQDVSHVFVSKRRERVRALDGVSLAIADGEFVSIVGPSGCGKSTMLRIIAGLIRPSVGRTFVYGAETRAARGQVGVVFQSPVLLAWRTVLDNVLLPAEVLKLPKREATSRALGLLAMAGLSGFERSYPFELSGGMQQRVAIVRALVFDPRTVLLDEPFGALDAMTREAMGIELLRIWQERRKTMLFITHSISEAVLLSDRVIVMSPRPGRLVRSFEVRMPRPRTLLQMADPAFAALCGEIRLLLEANT